MATSPFAGAGLSQFGQEMSYPGLFDSAKDKLKKTAAIALLNGTGITNFLDSLGSGDQQAEGVAPPQMSPIKPYQTSSSSNYFDDTGKIVSFNPSVGPVLTGYDQIDDELRGTDYLRRHKE